MRRLHRDMGHTASYGTFVNLFVNGDYKAYYNLVERFDEHFFAGRHGPTTDWDVYRGRHVVVVPDVAAGDLEKWDELFDIVNTHDLSNPLSFGQVAARVDLENYIDYLLLNIYGATSDWPNANWVAARPRQPDGQLRFYVWDAEGTFGSIGKKTVRHNTIVDDLENVESPITLLYRALLKNADFRMLFADRIQRHFSMDGALSDRNISARYRELERQLRRVVEWV